MLVFRQCMFVGSAQIKEKTWEPNWAKRGVRVWQLQRNTLRKETGKKGVSGFLPHPSQSMSRTHKGTSSVITGTLCSLFPNTPRGSMALPCPCFSPCLNSTIEHSISRVKVALFIFSFLSLSLQIIAEFTTENDTVKCLFCLTQRAGKILSEVHATNIFCSYL